MKETCIFVIDIRQFLGACVFYLTWIAHFTHVVDALYQLLQKGQRFHWNELHTNVMRMLKQLLSYAPTLRKVNYEHGRPIIVTVDSSPIRIGWAIG